MIWLSVFGILNVRADVHAYGGCTNTVRESARTNGTTLISQNRKSSFHPCIVQAPKFQTKTVNDLEHPVKLVAHAGANGIVTRIILRMVIMIHVDGADNIDDSDAYDDDDGDDDNDGDDDKDDDGDDDKDGDGDDDNYGDDDNDDDGDDHNDDDSDDKNDDDSDDNNNDDDGDDRVDNPDLIGSLRLGHGFVEGPVLLSGAVGLNGGRHGPQQVRSSAAVPLCGLGGTHAQHELHVKHGH